MLHSGYYPDISLQVCPHRFSPVTPDPRGCDARSDRRGGLVLLTFRQMARSIVELQVDLALPWHLLADRWDHLLDEGVEIRLPQDAEHVAEFVRSWTNVSIDKLNTVLKLQKRMQMSSEAARVET